MAYIDKLIARHRMIKVLISIPVARSKGKGRKRMIKYHIVAKPACETYPKGNELGLKYLSLGPRQGKWVD
jgi:hypothetical protein